MEPRPQGHLLLPMCLEQEVREVLRGSGAAPCPPPKDDRLPPVHTVTRMDLLVALGGRGQEGGGQSRVHGEEGGLGTSKGTLIHSPPPTADRENNLYNG